MQALIRRIAFLLLALASCLSISAPAQQPQAEAPLAEPALPESALPEPPPPPPLPPLPTGEKAVPALWVVSDEDTTIYLFGTIHAMPPGIAWLGGPVLEAFDGSQELVTEITEADPLEMQRLVLARALLPEGQSLRGMLTADVRAAYEKQLGALEMPAQVFDGYEPWYAAVALSTIPLSKAGYDSTNGVEQVLDARAKALGRPHSGLETAEYQLTLFDSLPLDTQKRYFAEVVAQLPTVSQQLDAVIAAWRKGDAEELAQLINAEEDDPLMIDVLLTSRNRAWADWIKKRLDQPGAVFVAVGAGHLAGPGSVQEQLARQGVVSKRLQ